VTPNRRGVKSRELVLDAAERVMAEHGFEAETLARVVEEAGIPMSSVYHYFGPKDGILLAVMERGADCFFADLPDVGRRPGRPEQHLARVVSAAARTLQRHPGFLRLLIVFAAQPQAAGDGEIQAVVCRVREHALELLRRRSRSRSATIRGARSLTSSRASRSPPSTAPSWPVRPTAEPRSSTCSSRSCPHW
jgi:AcrR family transcriptional regulator